MYFDYGQESDPHAYQNKKFVIPIYVTHIVCWNKQSHNTGTIWILSQLMCSQFWFTISNHL